MSNEDIRGPSRAWLRQRIAYPLAFIAAALAITTLLLGSGSDIDTSAGEKNPLLYAASKSLLNPSCSVFAQKEPCNPA